MTRRILPALVAISFTLFPLLTGPVRADEQKVEQLHVRGTVETLGASVLKVKTREGETLDVALAEGWKIAAVARAQVSDIKPGDFVGIASMPKAEGGDGALEVLIFPPALRGAGEGSYGWDLKPQSSMTNATVANAVEDIQGRTLTVSYNGQQKKIAIPDGTPVVTLAAATKDDLVPGAVVFILAEKAAGGVLGRQIIVGKDGVVPPM